METTSKAAKLSEIAKKCLNDLEALGYVGEVAFYHPTEDTTRVKMAHVDYDESLFEWPDDE